MKQQKANFLLTSIFCLLLVSCTKPIEIYLQNIGQDALIIYGTITNRKSFIKLPNQVPIYTLSMDKYENWIKDDYLAWKDSVNYEIIIPPKSQVKISDLSDQLILGINSPYIRIFTANDTIFRGDGRDFHRLYESQNYSRIKRSIYKVELHQ